MQLRGRHMASAALVAVGLHVGAALWVIWTPDTSGAIGAGSGGLEISLGTAGGAPGAADLVEPDPIQETEVDPVEAEPSEIAPDETSPPETVTEAEPVETPELTPTETVEAKPVTAVEPEPVIAKAEPIETVTPAEIVPTLPEPVEQQLTEPVEQEIAKPVEQPVIQEAKPVEVAEPKETQIAAVTPTETIDAEARPVMPTPKAKPKPPAHMLNKNKPKKPAKQPAKAQPAKKKAQPKKTEGEAQQAAIDTGDTDGQGNEGSVGAQQNTGTAQQSSSGGNPGAKRDYMAQVAAILQRNKKYPRRARSRRQEGTGQLYFVVDSNGTIVASTLRKSSGHKLLDKEILTILERVGKLPPFPDDLSVATLDIIVPIQFVIP